MIDFNHYPVMKNEAIKYLGVKPDGIYADLTLGGGSHSMEMAKIVENGKIIAVDRDADAIDYSRKKLREYEDKIIFVKDNYANIKEIANSLGYEKIDGALMDCGISSYQIDEALRGFSYMRDGALDMRQDREQELTAADIISYTKPGFFKRAAPSPFFTIFGTGHPMLISSVAFSRLRKSFAAEPTTEGQLPKI